MRSIETSLATLAAVVTTTACTPQLQSSRAETAQAVAEAVQPAPPVSRPECMVALNTFGDLTKCYYPSDLGKSLTIRDDGTVNLQISATCPDRRAIGQDKRGTFACLPKGFYTYRQFEEDCEQPPEPSKTDPDKVISRSTWMTPTVELKHVGAGIYPSWECKESGPSIMWDEQNSREEINRYMDKETQEDVCRETVE